MKSIIKVILTVSLFSSFVTADEGNMGSGSRTCTPPTTTNCRLVIETDDTVSVDQATTENDSVFDYIRDYLFTIFE